MQEEQDGFAVLFFLHIFFIGCFHARTISRTA